MDMEGRNNWAGQNVFLGTWAKSPSIKEYKLADVIGLF